jgi:nucleoside-diphosphate-sugar epimerase
MTKQHTALILGATGGVGGELARALVARGWQVRAMHRDPGKIRKPISGATWVRGDAMNRGDVIATADGVDLVVHAVNPPGYRNWAGLALPMLENTVAAARESGARIFFPGTVYNFDAEKYSLVAEDTPQTPLTRKGAIRVAMEACLQRAAADGVRSLILRAGDFFGPTSAAGNSWFSGAMIKPGRRVTSVTYPGRPDVGHAWAYLPDYVETAMRLIARDAELSPFAMFHFGGHWCERGIEMAEAVRAAVGEPRLPIRKFPWWLITLASPFVETFREMQEMTYLWRLPLRLDNRRLVALLGEEPHTPAVEAVRATLLGLGSLPGRRGRGAAAVPLATST